jgi:hypothetical protein
VPVGDGPHPFTPVTSGFVAFRGAGTVRVAAAALTEQRRRVAEVVRGQASVWLSQKPQDYVPPQTESLVMMLDTSGAGTSVPRGVQRGGMPRAAVSVASRLDYASASGETTVWTAADDSTEFGRQNATDVLSFTATGAGLIGAWGPFPDGAWTLVAYIRAEQPVHDYGHFIGAGPMTLVDCPAASIRVHVPAGGAVPAAALAESGGPITGATADAPWDVVFVNQWRQLAVRNDAAAGVRTVLVDGWPAFTAPATQEPVPAGSALVVGAGCPVALAELLVWNTAAISDADLRSTLTAQRAKWGVHAVAAGTVPVVGNPAVASATLDPARTATGSVTEALGAGGLPYACWLDAASADNVRAAGLVPVPANGYVRRWTSRLAGGSAAVFPERAAAWMWRRDETVNRLPVVAVGADGVLQPSPLADLAGTTTACLAVAVWRVRHAAGGHPFSVDGAARFGPGADGWIERFGMAYPYPVGLAASEFPADGALVLGAWEREPGDGGAVYRLGGLRAAHGGLSYRVPASAVGPWTGTETVALGAGPRLCELLVWTGSAVPDDASRDAVKAYLDAKWAVSAFPAVAGPTRTLAPAWCSVRIVRRIDTADGDATIAAAGVTAYAGATALTPIWGSPGPQWAALADGNSVSISVDRVPCEW